MCRRHAQTDTGPALDYRTRHNIPADSHEVLNLGINHRFPASLNAIDAFEVREYPAPAFYRQERWNSVDDVLHSAGFLGVALSDLCANAPVPKTMYKIA